MRAQRATWRTFLAQVRKTETGKGDAARLAAWGGNLYWKLRLAWTYVYHLNLWPGRKAWELTAFLFPGALENHKRSIASPNGFWREG